MHKLWEKVIRYFRPEPPSPPAQVAPVIVRKCPVLDKFRNRYSPEYSGDGEELHCNGMLAEDGSLRIYRDYLTPGKPVVEVHINGTIFDLRGCPALRTTQGFQRHPKWHAVQKMVLEWLLAHDCDEAKTARLGFWVYDPAA